MDIRDYWVPFTGPNDDQHWSQFIEARDATFKGFAQREASQGFINPAVSVKTTHGQEMVRILAMRVLEELAEAHQSADDDHFFEELIDAFNYLLSLHMFVKPEALEIYLAHISKTSLGFKWKGETRPTLKYYDLGECVIALGNNLGDELRNRAWMLNTQNSYFDGDMEKILLPVYSLILGFFKDFQHFATFFMAKDAVLQFRLRSSY